MDVKITPSGGDTIRLCMLPETIKMGGNGKFMTYSIINLGDVEVPRGTGLEEVSWKGKFPGEDRKKDIFVRSQVYRNPKEYIRLFRSWKDKGTKCNLTVSGTGINMDVYVKSFSGEFTGGHGDFDYEVKFVKARTITITSKTVSSSRPPSNASNSQQNQTTQRYTVKYGDCLWSIAQKFLGNGARYPEIYQLNRATIDAHRQGPNCIRPGDVLVLPAR